MSRPLESHPTTPALEPLSSATATGVGATTIPTALTRIHERQRPRAEVLFKSTHRLFSLFSLPPSVLDGEDELGAATLDIESGLDVAAIDNAAAPSPGRGISPVMERLLFCARDRDGPLER